MFIAVIFSFISLFAQNFTEQGLGSENAADNNPTPAILMELAEKLLHTNPQEALEMTWKASEMAKALHQDDAYLEANRRIAAIYWNLSRYDTALIIGHEVLELSVAQKNRKEQAKILRTLGVIYRDLQAYQRSSEFLFEAYKIFEEDNDQEGISNSLNSIGILLSVQGDTNNAREYFMKSLQISRETGDLSGIARGLNNLVMSDTNQLSMTYSKHMLLEAIGINKQLGQLYLEGGNYINLGELYQKESNPDSSLFYLRNAENLFRKISNLSGLTSTYESLSSLYQSTGNMDSSMYYAEKAMHIADSAKLISSRISVAKRLSDLYLIRLDLVKHNEFDLLYYRLKDSLASTENNNRIEQLETIYQFDKKIERQQLEQQQKIFKHRILILSLVFVSIVVLVFLVLRQKLKNKSALEKKKELEIALDQKNKELTLNVMSLMKKNEVITGVLDKLSQIQDTAGHEDARSTIQSIVRDLKKTSKQEIWNDFEVLFKQVHESFYQNLISRFPSLTPNELKLSAFVKLNLSSKEISELTGQSVTTIETARTRLRKKLGIDNTNMTLVSFFSQF
jgi:tetratricopeptide (TPR) repeat protein